MLLLAKGHPIRESVCEGLLISLKMPTFRKSVVSILRHGRFVDVGADDMGRRKENGNRITQPGLSYLRKRNFSVNWYIVPPFFLNVNDASMIHVPTIQDALISLIFYRPYQWSISLSEMSKSYKSADLCFRIVSATPVRARSSPC